MYTFHNKINENIKFNLSPLITKINTRYSFESGIIKTLSFFNNKNVKQNIINSSIHKSTSLRPKSEKNINTSYNNGKQNIKYNIKLISNNNTLKHDINRNNERLNNKNKSNKNKNYNSINSKKPSNLSININNHTNNYYYNYSNNLFNDKIIERNKREIQIIKTEISKYNHKKSNNDNNKANYIINTETNNKSNKLFNITNINNKLYSYNTNRNYFNKKLINKSNYNSKTKSSKCNTKYNIKTNSYSKMNNKKKENNGILIVKSNNINKDSLISLNSNNKFSYRNNTPSSSKVNNNYNINFYTLNSINSEKILLNEYHTLDNNVHHHKKYIINNFNVNENNDLINKKASKTYNGFFKPSSKNIDEEDKKKNNKEYKIKIVDEKINKNNFDNLHIYPNNHNYYEYKYSDKNTSKDNILKNKDKNNYLHYEVGNYDYKDKLSKIKEKTEGLLEKYSKLLKLYQEGKIDINKNN